MLQARPKSARSLEQAANSNQTLEGFQAINNEHLSEELKEEAKADNPKDREKGHPVP